MYEFGGGETQFNPQHPPFLPFFSDLLLVAPIGWTQIESKRHSVSPGHFPLRLISCLSPRDYIQLHVMRTQEQW